ncbi:hypothetical protein BH09SUM1_BH09SUM1_24020 [soil metagenome]
MKFLVTLVSGETSGYVVHCPAIPGCVSQGDTKEEALANITEAIELCTEVIAERGSPEFIEIHEVEASSLSDLA